ncbi:MAG: two-component system sensor histidine kinase BarA [Alphaproteobacteria bacterium]|jgi:two-component system sensor histidine kinase BarA
MVAYFNQKHNRPLRKHKRLIQFFVAICCLTTQFMATAEKDSIIVDDSFTSRLLSEEFSVYYQESRVLTFEEFKKSRNLLPYRTFKTSNFGFVKNGAWLYAKIENRSQINTWMLDIRFSQLQNAQVYITSGGKLIQSGTDGIQKKTSPYPLPSFELNLPNNTPLEIYIYVKSSSMMLVAPIYLQTYDVHKTLFMLDFSIWGVYYGALLVLFLYAITFTVYKNKFFGFVYIVHLFVMLLFQLLWSGHTALLFEWVNTLFLHIRAESMTTAMSISFTLLNLMLIPSNMHNANIRKILKYLLYVNLFFFFAFLIPVFLPQVKLTITYMLGFGVLSINFAICVNAFINGFVPARALLVGWTASIIGSTLSALFIFGILPSNPFHQHMFHFTLLLQTGIFLLAMVLRNQYNLQLEVKQAESDTISNFELIEEQNVHLDLARKEAIKASEVKSQFLANMSHEIRTPLNAIIGFSKELENKQNVLEREEHVRIINSAASDLLTVVNDILDFSKMEAGKLTLNTRPFSPRDVLEDVAALMSKNAHLKQLEFIFEVDKLPDFLLGDAFKIKQLLSNLLSNALKFTNFGHIKLAAKVIEQSENECIIEFTVEDSGIGISRLDLNKLFTAFQQLDDDLNRSFQGTGLGLVICQELTRFMGGQINVSSRPTHGSIFTATIPFTIDYSATQLSKKPSFAGQTAYVIDDWDESRQAAIKQLEAVGFKAVAMHKVSQLRDYKVGSDYVFVSFPFRSIERRSDITEQLIDLRIINIVFMYSGPEPSKFNHDMSLPQPKLIRMPLTTRKLEDIDASFYQVSEGLSNECIDKLPAIRILAVDDMELNLRLLQTWLKSSPITLDIAYNGQSAIDRCKDTDYDLILMDIQMPSMDGLEATRLIRKTSLNIGTPIVAVTAHAMEQEQQHFLDSGMDDFLSKPLKLENLVTLINTWCEQLPVEKKSEELVNATANSIDWGMALRLCYNNQDSAIEFLDAFTQRLLLHANEIESGWEQQRADLMLASVHKLHGACCYTGVPRLQVFCDQAQTLLKTEPLEQHSKTITSLLLEINQVIEVWPKLRKSLVLSH